MLLGCFFSEYDYFTCLGSSGYLFLNGLGVYQSATAETKPDAGSAVPTKVNLLSDEQLGAKMSGSPAETMLRALTLMPPFSDYNLANPITGTIHDYWQDPAAGGGPVTQSLRTKSIEGIETPLKSMIETTENYGFYELKRIQSSKKLNTSFYDVWLLSTDSKDAGRLLDLNRYGDDTVICCMWNDGW